MSNQMSTPDKAGAFDLTINVGGQSYTGQVCLNGDKVIINKAIMEMIAELFPQARVGDVDQYPEYLYFSREEMAGVWESMLQYRDNQAPQELKDLLVFLVEAIPEQYFTASLSGVSFKLDQAGLEDVIYSLLLKVKDEKERAADIIVGLSTMYGKNSAIDPVKIKADIIAGIDSAVTNGSFPTKEQLHLMSQFVQVKDFYYQAALPPSAAKEFKLALELSPITGFPGSITITSKTSGSKNNINGVMDILLAVNGQDGSSYSGSLNQTYTYQEKIVDSQMVLTAKASNSSADSNLLDLEIKGSSTQQVDQKLNINIPVLNATNSMDITPLIEQAGNKDKIMIFINGKPVSSEAEPFIQDGRTLVPVRMVSEALGCEVKWIPAGSEVRLSRGSDVISMFIGNNNYTINGNNKQMDARPIIKDNYTFVPVRFVAEALNCEVKWQEPNMVFITTK